MKRFLFLFSFLLSTQFNAQNKTLYGWKYETIDSTLNKTIATNFSINRYKRETSLIDEALSAMLVVGKFNGENRLIITTNSELENLYGEYMPVSFDQDKPKSYKYSGVANSYGKSLVFKNSDEILKNMQTKDTMFVLVEFFRFGKKLYTFPLNGFDLSKIK